MIKFLGKFTRDGKIVAWRISEDGVESNIAYRAIYHEFYFNELRNSGYKFHDYNGNVTTPDGFSLADIVESDEYLSDTELIDLIDIIEQGGMYEEKDIVQYFDRDVNIVYVAFAEPLSKKINTREDLNNYIDAIATAQRNKMNKFSALPVNAIADKNALFSIEEVVSNTDNAAFKFATLFSSTFMDSYENIKTLMKTYGVTDDTSSKTQQMVKLLQGYYQWGIPGLNAKATNIRIETNPVDSMNNFSQSIDDWASLKYGVRRNSDFMFFCEDLPNGEDFYSIDGNEYVDTNGHIDSVSINTLKAERISDDFVVAPYGFRNINPRIIIDLLSDDGISATFVADVDEAHLIRSSVDLITPSRTFAFSTIDGFNMKLSRIFMDGLDYISDSVMIRAFIADRIKKSTVVPKYKSSFDLLTGIGVSPYFVPMYVNKLIKEGSPTTVEIDNAQEFSSLHRYCSSTFKNGFSNTILEKYGPGGEEFAAKPIIEQLEYINEEIGNLQSEGKYLVKPTMEKGAIKIADQAYNEWFDEYNANEVKNANFVVSLMNGTQNVGRMAVGMILDEESMTDSKLFNTVFSAFCAAKNDNPGITCDDFVTNYVGNYIDLDEMFSVRNHTAIGCSKDIVSCRSDMVYEANTIVYITKIFRENSNADIGTAARHWGFECVAIDKSKKSTAGQVYHSIYSQIINDLDAKGLTSERLIAGDAAANILMNIAMSKNEVVGVDGVCHIPFKTTLSNGFKYTLDIKVGETYYNNVRRGTDFHTAYSSCYDFCENQFNAATLQCEYYCINASINPWFITPREGFEIMDYNLLLNYFTVEELANNFPKVVIDKMYATGAKVVKCLRDSADQHPLFPQMCSIFTASEEAKYAREGMFLEEREHESLDNYITRTCNDINTERANGRAVLNTVLKSDVQYGMFKAPIICDGVDSDSTYYEEFSKPASNRYVTAMAPRKLNSDWVANVSKYNLLESDSRVKIERINFEDIPYESKLYNKNLRCSKFNAIGNVYVRKGHICYGGLTKDLYSLTQDDMCELVGSGFAIQYDSNSYVVKTINGLLKVSV